MGSGGGGSSDGGGRVRFGWGQIAIILVVVVTIFAIVAIGALDDGIPICFAWLPLLHAFVTGQHLGPVESIFLR